MPFAILIDMRHKHQDLNVFYRDSVRYGLVEILTHMVGKKVEEVSCYRDFAHE